MTATISQSTSATTMKTTAATPLTTADRAFFMALVACTGSPVVIPSAPTSRMPWAAPK